MLLIKKPYSFNLKKLIPNKLNEIRFKGLLEKQKKHIFNIGFNPQKNLFKKILIETISKCNNNCAFCPVNISKREQGIMDFDLLEKILIEIRNLNYTGKIALFCNNEPLLDINLIEKIRLAKKILPNAYHYLLTNGINLTYEDLTALDDVGLNQIVINNYNDFFEFIPPVEKIVEKLKKKKLQVNVIVQLRKKNDVLGTRGGKAPNKSITINPYANNFCLYPFFQLNINWKGEVFFCCNDVEWEIVVGEIKKNSVLDIWKGKKYERLRNILLTQGRKGISICSKCDSYVVKTI